MSLLTNWGYTLTDVTTLPDIMTEDEYDVYTASKYASDDRAYNNIKAAASAIRNYCGWHIYPSEACELSTTLYDKRITKVNGGLSIQLPSTYVSAVTSVSIAGTEYTTFVIDPNGTLRVYGVDFSDIYPYSPVVVEFESGLPDGMIEAVKELIAHRVTHALASTDGVQSEMAGGVSITYSSSWMSSARSTALPDDNKEVLSPYRLRGVF